MKIIYTKSYKKKPALFIDRDGVINRDVKGKYITSIKDVRIYQTAVKGLKKIKGYHLIIITNQSAIGRGMITLTEAVKINNFIITKLRENGIKINAVYFCPHRPDEKCRCRKPATGLINEAKKDFKILMEKSIMIGDKNSDIETALNAGIKSVMVLTGQGRTEYKKIKSKPDAVIRNLLSLSKIIKILIFMVMIVGTNPLHSEIKEFESFFKKRQETSEIEHFEYTIYWGIMNVGTASIEFGESYETYYGDKTYKIVSSASSNSFIDNFFKVRDINISYISTDAVKSYGYFKQIREGKHQFMEYTIFDYRKKIFYGKKIKGNSERDHSGDLKSDVIDALSALFSIIKTDNLEFKRKTLDMVSRNYIKLDIINHGIVKVKMPEGKISAYKLEPLIGDEGIFISKKGKSMYVYISKDQKIPVMLEAEVFIGSVRAILTQHYRLKK